MVADEVQHRFLVVLFATDGYENAAVAQVAAGDHAGYGDIGNIHPGIIDYAEKRLGDFLLEELIHPGEAVNGHRYDPMVGGEGCRPGGNTPYSCWVIFSTSYISMMSPIS